jgi:hypothetical protein
MRSAVIALLALIPLGLAAASLSLVRFQRWYVQSARGARYFGRSSAGRRAFAEEVRRRGRVATWIASRIVLLHSPKPPVGVELLGITAPPQCTAKDFARAIHYEPEEGDVFVVTQMKCGTTWMQQIVYEIAMRGQGDLSDGGSRHIYAVSPWLEASWAVPMEDAPRLGSSRIRLIKSHMPTKLLPIGEKGRYIYVTRHPIACFASCNDFVGMLLGPLAPSRKTLLDWFCSERMWWGPWPDHVDGWWLAAQSRPNVLFVHFEEMRADLPAIVDRVAAHIGVELSPVEREAVIRKSEFAYMKANEEQFSMAPPSPFGETGDFMPSGRSDRHADVLLPERARIIAFCRERLRGSSYPIGRFYSDLVP